MLLLMKEIRILQDYLQWKRYLKIFFFPEKPFVVEAADALRNAVSNDSMIIQSNHYSSDVFITDGGYILDSDYHESNYWDLNTGSLVMSYKNIVDERFEKISQSGEYVIIERDDDKITICNTKNNEVFDIKDEKGDVIIGSAFSPDSMFVACVFSSMCIRIYNLSNKKMIDFFKYDGKFMFLSVSGDGRKITIVSMLSHNKKQRVTMFDCKFKKINKWGIPANGTNSVILSSNHTFVIIPKGEKISIIDSETKIEKYLLNGHKDYIWEICCSLNERYIASNSQQSILIWDLGQGGICQTIYERERADDHHSSHFEGRNRNLLFSSDSKKLLYTIGNSIYEWDIENGKEIFIKKEDFEINSMAYDLDCRSVVYQVRGTIKYLGRNVNISPDCTKKSLSDALSVSICPNHQCIIVAPGNNYLEIWKLDLSEKIGIKEMLYPQRVLFGTLSPNKKYILSTIQNNIIIRNIETLDIEKKFSGHQGPVVFASFSEDGNKIVSISRDHSIRIWNTNTEKMNK